MWSKNRFYPECQNLYWAPFRRTSGTRPCQKVTLEFVQPFFNSGHNVVTDNYFTSRSLTIELLGNGLTLLGPIQKQRREIRPYLRQVRGLEQYSSRFAFDHQNLITMVVYIPRYLRPVILLSLSHIQHWCQREQRSMPTTNDPLLQQQLHQMRRWHLRWEHWGVYLSQENDKMAASTLLQPPRHRCFQCISHHDKEWLQITYLSLYSFLKCIFIDFQTLLSVKQETHSSETLHDSCWQPQTLKK